MWHAHIKIQKLDIDQDVTNLSVGNGEIKFDIHTDILDFSFSGSYDIGMISGQMSMEGKPHPCTLQRPEDLAAAPPPQAGGGTRSAGAEAPTSTRVSSNDEITGPSRGSGTASGPAGTVVRPGKDYALLLTESDYQNPKWKHLVNPPSDARSLAAKLRDIYGFTILDPGPDNPTYDQIRQKLVDLRSFQFSDPDHDQLLVYYAGHGIKDSYTEQGFLVPSDGEQDASHPAHLLQVSSFLSLIAQIPVKHTLVLIDSCYSGTGDEKNLVAEMRGPPQVFRTYAAVVEKMKVPFHVAVTSGSGPVQDGKAGENSPFMRSLLGALNGWDEKDNKILSFDTIAGKLQDGLLQLPTDQQPKRLYFGGQDIGGQFFFFCTKCERMAASH